MAVAFQNDVTAVLQSSHDLLAEARRRDRIEITGEEQGRHLGDDRRRGVRPPRAGGPQAACVDLLPDAIVAQERSADRVFNLRLIDTRDVLRAGDRQKHAEGEVAAETPSQAQECLGDGRHVASGSAVDHL